MIETIEYKGIKYPKFQTEGNSAQFILPYAKLICQGKGYDIGCNRENWALHGAIPIDITFEDGYDAYHLPKEKVDFIFSSHCLEHLSDWVGALEYWIEHLKTDGILFLYLPHYDQVYWRSWNNKKHKHIFTTQIIYDFLKDKDFKNIFFSERDLNHSFAIFGSKR